MLLVASYIFYMAWRVEYIVLIIFSTIVDYYCGLQMGKIEEKKKRKPYLYLSLLSNLGILFTFKYFNFFIDSINYFFDGIGMSLPFGSLELLLPMGISFYTFQTMSYSIDVYNGDIKPEKNFGIFALFVTFFPQLVAGPIERAKNILPQFRIEHKFDYDRVVSGLRLIGWGLFKKVVIADRLGILVDNVYNAPGDHSGVAFMVATIFFSFQIYCDFSGYSDIAIGSARIMGFKLMKNFDRPYFSKNIQEFWKRWHISLSTWFRDYVYIPLGGNRVVKWRWYYNLSATFLISGLWHGANWTFVFWGGLHGLYLIFNIISNPMVKKSFAVVNIKKNSFLEKLIRVSVTFFFVMIAWVFFRANNLNEAFYIVGHLFDSFGSWISPSYVFQSLKGLGVNQYDFLLSIFFLIVMLIVHVFQRDFSLETKFRQQPTWVRWSVYNFFLISILLFGVFDKTQFIYFQF